MFLSIESVWQHTCNVTPLCLLTLYSFLHILCVIFLALLCFTTRVSFLSILSVLSHMCCLSSFAVDCCVLLLFLCAVYEPKAISVLVVVMFTWLFWTTRWSLSNEKCISCLRMKLVEWTPWQFWSESFYWFLFVLLQYISTIWRWLRQFWTKETPESKSPWQERW